MIDYINIPNDYRVETDLFGADTYTRRDGNTSSGIYADQNRIRDIIYDIADQMNSLIDELNLNDSNYSSILAGHDESLSTLFSTTTEQGLAIDTINSSIATVNGYLDSLEVMLEDARFDIDTITTTQQSVLNNISDINSQITAMLLSIERIADSVNVYAWVDSIDQLPPATGAVGQVYAVGTAFAGAMTYTIAPGGVNIPGAFITGTAPTESALPTSVTGNVFYFVSDINTLFTPIYDSSGGLVDWIQAGYVNGIVATIENIPLPAPTQNDLLLAKVDRLVTDISQRPLTAVDYFTCAVDASGHLTQDADIFSFVGGVWYNLGYMPNHTLYLYSTDLGWIRISDHAIQIDRFLEWADLGTLENGLIEFADRPSLPHSGTEQNGNYLVFSWAAGEGSTLSLVPVDSLGAVYSAGSGLSLSGAQFSVKISPNADNSLTEAEGSGLYVPKSVDVSTVEGNEIIKKSDGLFVGEIRVGSHIGYGANNRVRVRLTTTPVPIELAPPKPGFIEYGTVLVRWDGSDWIYIDSWKAHSSESPLGTSAGGLGGSYLSLSEVKVALGVPPLPIPTVIGGLGEPFTDLTALAKELLKLACPYRVGDILESYISENPNLTWPGTTWTSYGAGRVMVGTGTNGTTSYPSSNATGGSESVSLAEANLPSHRHKIADGGYNSSNTGGARVAMYWGYSDTVAAYTSYTGSGTAHENRMPYITVYRWRRTA